MGYVYLIHLEKPIGKGNQQHYVGFARDLEHYKERISKHRNNEGSKLLKAANDEGINWIVVRVWADATADTEKAVKQRSMKNTCPVCWFKEKDRNKRSVSRANSKLLKEKGIS